MPLSLYLLPTVYVIPRKSVYYIKVIPVSLLASHSILESLSHMIIGPHGHVALAISEAQKHRVSTDYNKAIITPFMHYGRQKMRQRK